MTHRRKRNYRIIEGKGTGIPFNPSRDWNGQVPQFKPFMFPFPHKIFFLQIIRFLKDAMNCAFHFPGSFTDLFYLFKPLKKKKKQGKIKPSENHSRVQRDDIKQPVRPILSMEEDLWGDTEEWYGTHSDPTALALLSPCCAAVGESTNPTKKCKCGINCWSRPMSLLCHFIPPTGMPVGLETKAVLSWL